MALNLNEKKIETFLEVTKGLDEAFNVIPVLFGSLGLYKVLGVNKKANDIDQLGTGGGQVRTCPPPVPNEI